MATIRKIQLGEAPYIKQSQCHVNAYKTHKIYICILSIKFDDMYGKSSTKTDWKEWIKVWKLQCISCVCVLMNFTFVSLKIRVGTDFEPLTQLDILNS